MIHRLEKWNFKKLHIINRKLALLKPDIFKDTIVKVHKLVEAVRGTRFTIYLIKTTQNNNNNNITMATKANLIPIQ